MYKDRYGHTVRVVSTCADRQRVAYQLKGYEWTINAALIVFNARFRRDAA
ncbi:DUF4222 domain-containing protein [Edwardsiella piscicida]|nr:DUF4222 domain-containing protein [Edwardsiella piscicida]WLJ48280.1 DUF4222 domain-containing protein [Edwardsiella piscicida]